MANNAFLAGCAAGLVLLAGCSFAPKYHVPDMPIPTAFKEQGIWTRATPEDALPKTSWWTLYGDPTLDALEAQIEGANPTLAEALARYDRARAQLSILRAGLYPEVDTGAHALRNRQSDNRPLRSASQPDVYTDNLFGFSLDYEIDLWGRVRNTVASGKA
jgi:outer membrane protein TolC